MRVLMAKFARSSRVAVLVSAGVGGGGVALDAVNQIEVAKEAKMVESKGWVEKSLSRGGVWRDRQREERRFAGWRVGGASGDQYQRCDEKQFKTFSHGVGGRERR
ncbi:MAG: hypothetical protein U0V48_05670 [Anaerolineales bacterium]